MLTCASGPFFLLLGDFFRRDVCALLGVHPADTGRTTTASSHGQLPEGARWEQGDQRGEVWGNGGPLRVRGPHPEKVARAGHQAGQKQCAARVHSLQTEGIQPEQGQELGLGCRPRAGWEGGGWSPPVRLWPSETCPMPDSRGLWAVPVGRVDHTHHPHAGVGLRGCRRKPEESMPRGPRGGGAPLPRLLGRTARRRSAPCALRKRRPLSTALRGAWGGTSGGCPLRCCPASRSVLGLYWRGPVFPRSGRPASLQPPNS